jgi:biopolymer transport protein ExbB
MLITFAAAAAANGAAVPAENPYGLIPALKEGGPLSMAVFVILVIMSVGSFYILFAKLFEQNRIMAQAKKVRASFWNTPNLREGANKLEKDSAYRQLVEDGLRAEEQHTLLTNEVDQHDWTLNALARTRGAIGAKLNKGLSFLATTGSTAPFIGLFGTVIGILSALVKIGAAGQASIDAVAGPVGEALIMTAIGLAVAVPAVLAFNWLQARNKAILEDLSTFSNDVHGFMASGGSVKPVSAAAGVAAAPTGHKQGSGTVARPGSTTTTAGQVGGVPTNKA